MSKWSRVVSKRRRVQPSGSTSERSGVGAPGHSPGDGKGPVRRVREIERRRWPLGERKRRAARRAGHTEATHKFEGRGPVVAGANDEAEAERPFLCLETFQSKRRPWQLRELVQFERQRRHRRERRRARMVAGEVLQAGVDVAAVAVGQYIGITTALKEAAERARFHALWHLRARKVQNRRRNVERRHRHTDRHVSTDPRAKPQQRHFDCALPWLVLAEIVVVVQELAVIRAHDHHCIRPLRPSIHCVEDPIEEHVKVLNLGCIVAPLARKAWLAACVVTWRPVMVTLGRVVHRIWPVSVQDALRHGRGHNEGWVRPGERDCAGASSFGQLCTGAVRRGDSWRLAPQRNHGVSFGARRSSSTALSAVQSS